MGVLEGCIYSHLISPNKHSANIKFSGLKALKSDEGELVKQTAINACLL